MNGNGKPAYVDFLAHQPEAVALAYPDGVEKDGMYGPRVMYTLADGRLMFLDPDVAQKIRSMQIQPRQTFWICKRPGGRGRKTLWDVYLEDPTPRATESAFERDLRLSAAPAQVNAHRAYAEKVRAGQISEGPAPASVQQLARPNEAATCQSHSTDTSQHISPRPVQRPEWSVTLERQAGILIDVYAALIAHATEQHHGLVKPEDVRALLTTTFINLSQKGRGATHAA